MYIEIETSVQRMLGALCTYFSGHIVFLCMYNTCTPDGFFLAENKVSKKVHHIIKTFLYFKTKMKTKNMVIYCCYKNITRLGTAHG